LLHLAVIRPADSRRETKIQAQARDNKGKDKDEAISWWGWVWPGEEIAAADIPSARNTLDSFVRTPDTAASPHPLVGLPLRLVPPSAWPVVRLATSLLPLPAL
jgi:hypothetical protein